jgi:hypothetical protein
VSAALKRAGWVALCAAPVAARLLGPNVTPNDGFYAHAAFMLSRGATPYHDFDQVAFPLAECVLALAMRLFGPGLRTVELANALMIGAVALALRAAGRALAGPRAGAVAALAWCWSLWVVHFNLFERETWAALGALAFGATRLSASAGRAGNEAAARPESRCRRRRRRLLLAVLVKITGAVRDGRTRRAPAVRSRARAGARLAPGGARHCSLPRSAGCCGPAFLVRSGCSGGSAARKDFRRSTRSASSWAGPTRSRCSASRRCSPSACPDCAALRAHLRSCSSRSSPTHCCSAR